MAYATLDETYLLALSERAFVVAPSAIQSAADLATGTIRLTAHGFHAADRILFSVTSGGSLTPELSPFIYYTPIRIGPDLFKVADPVTGLPIVFTEASRGWAVKVDPERRLALHLEESAARIDQCLTAHSGPIKPDPVTGQYPFVLRGLNARMAARAAVTSLQIENPEFREPMDRLFAQAKFDGDTDPPAQPGSLLGDWKMGMPVMPTPIDQNTIADTGPRAHGRCALPWQRGWL